MSAPVTEQHRLCGRNVCGCYACRDLDNTMCSMGTRATLAIADAEERGASREREAMMPKHWSINGDKR